MKSLTYRNLRTICSVGPGSEITSVAAAGSSDATAAAGLDKSLVLTVLACLGTSFPI